jgi:hypothetical protein
VSGLRLFAPPPLTPVQLRSVLEEVEAAAGSQRILLLPALAGVERGLARTSRGRLDPALLPWLVRVHREALHACAPGAAELPVSTSWLASLAAALPAAGRGEPDAAMQVAATGPRLAVAVAVASLRAGGTRAFGCDAAGLLRVSASGVDTAATRRALRWALRGLPGDAVAVVPAGFGATREGRLVRLADAAGPLAAVLGVSGESAAPGRPAQVA